MRGLYLVAEEEVVDQAIGVAAQMTPKMYSSANGQWPPKNP
jgi:hypothetical protein